MRSDGTTAVHPSAGGASTLGRVGAVVARHPSLWPTAARQWRRVVPTGWWRQRPFLPLPRAEYLRFRLLTQYGDTKHVPAPEDVLHYLRWCRQHDR